MNKSIGDAAYNVDADFNRDGIVNSTDSTILNNDNPTSALAAVLLSDPTIDNQIGWDGYCFHAETLLSNARYRWYDSVQGRFIERDPWEYVDEMNSYENVGGRPLSFIDPFGLCAQENDPGAWSHLLSRRRFLEWVEDNNLYDINPNNQKWGWILLVEDERELTKCGWDEDWGEFFKNNNSEDWTPDMLRKKIQEMMDSDKYKHIFVRGVEAHCSYGASRSGGSGNKQKRAIALILKDNKNRGIKVSPSPGLKIMIMGAVSVVATGWSVFAAAQEIGKASCKDYITSLYRNPCSKRAIRNKADQCVMQIVERLGLVGGLSKTLMEQSLYDMQKNACMAKKTYDACCGAGQQKDDSKD